MITFSKLGQYGRFGNQLWQIASTIGIAKKNDLEFGFPKWKYSWLFTRPLPEINYYDFIFRHVIEKQTTYLPMILDKFNNYDIEGYFQSYRYFQDIQEIIRSYFETKSNEYFNSGNKDFVSIHVRRGDYLNLQHTHPLLDLSYYQRAMMRFSRGTKFLVFSDDIPWCKSHILGDNVYYYDFDEKRSFIAMKNCRHNIIANSSFSWWAAWLNPNPDKIIIAPKVWVHGEDRDDRVPPGWIRL